MPEIDLREDHLKIIADLLAVHLPDCEVGAFGSRVTHTAKKFSDLDLVVKGRGKLDASRFFRLQEAFEESDLPFRVDLLDWHAVSDAFRKIIAEHYIVLQTPEK